MLWKLLSIENLQRFWLPSKGQDFGGKLQESFEPRLRPVRLRVYRRGRFH